MTVSIYGVYLGPVYEVRFLGSIQVNHSRNGFHKNLSLMTSRNKILNSDPLKYSWGIVV